MTAGIRALSKAQFGLETTAGTAVVADTIWRGVASLQDDRVLEFPEENIAYLPGVDRSYTQRLGATLSMASTPATFEQLPVIFSCGVMKDEDGEADSTGSGKIYTHTAATNGVVSLSTATWEVGDNQRVDEMEYAFVESFTLDGKAGEALMVSANWRGRQASDAEFTTTATLPTVEEIIFSRGTLYIDTAGGTIGTTVKSATLMGMKLDYNTGVKPIYAANGQLYFSHTEQTMQEATLDLTFLHDGTAEAEIAAWRAHTPRLLQLKFPGSALTTAGDYASKTLILNCAGRWEKFGVLDDEDGNDVVTGTMRLRYNTTAGRFFQAIVVTELAGI